MMANDPLIPPQTPVTPQGEPAGPPQPMQPVRQQEELSAAAFLQQLNEELAAATKQANQTRDAAVKARGKVAALLQAGKGMGEITASPAFATIQEHRAAQERLDDAQAMFRATGSALIAGATQERLAQAKMSPQESMQFLLDAGLPKHEAALVVMTGSPSADYANHVAFKRWTRHLDEQFGLGPGDVALAQAGGTTGQAALVERATGRQLLGLGAGSKDKTPEQIAAETRARERAKLEVKRADELKRLARVPNFGPFYAALGLDNDDVERRLASAAKSTADVLNVSVSEIPEAFASAIASGRAPVDLAFGAFSSMRRTFQASLGSDAKSSSLFTRVQGRELLRSHGITDPESLGQQIAIALTGANEPSFAMNLNQLRSLLDSLGFGFGDRAAASSAFNSFSEELSGLSATREIASPAQYQGAIAAATAEFIRSHTELGPFDPALDEKISAAQIAATE